MSINRCRICDNPIDTNLTLSRYKILVKKPFDRAQKIASETVKTTLCVRCGADWLSMGLGEMHGTQLKRWVNQVLSGRKHRTIRTCYNRTKLGIIGRKKREANPI